MTLLDLLVCFIILGFLDKHLDKIAIYTTKLLRIDILKQKFTKTTLPIVYKKNQVQLSFLRDPQDNEIMIRFENTSDVTRKQLFIMVLDIESLVDRMQQTGYNDLNRVRGLKVNEQEWDKLHNTLDHLRQVQIKQIDRMMGQLS